MVEDAPASRPRLEPPPHTGFAIGSEEDSLGSCMSLRPTQPKRDFKKMDELAGCVLTFGSRMLSGRSEDEDRMFTIQSVQMGGCLIQSHVPIALWLGPAQVLPGRRYYFRVRTSSEEHRSHGGQILAEGPPQEV